MDDSVLKKVSKLKKNYWNGKEVSKLKKLLEWIISIAVAFVILFIVGKFIVTPYMIKGESMDPTLKDGERVAVNIIGYKTGGLEKGNVVVFANKMMTMLNVLSVFLVIK